MARRRYPSDWPENRNKRPSVRVHLTWVNHPQYAEVCADPVLRGVVLGIWMVAMRAFACQTDDTVTLTPGDIDWITGGGGLELLRAACEAMHYEMHEGARCVRVQVRNLSKKQGFTPQNSGGVSVERNADSAGASESESDSSSPPPIPSPSVPSPPVSLTGIPDTNTHTGPTSSAAVFALSGDPTDVGPEGKNGKARKVRKSMCLMPKEMSDEEFARLQRLVKSRGLSEHEVLYACKTVYNWSHGRGNMARDWVLTTVNAIRAGWALKGITDGSQSRRR